VFALILSTAVPCYAITPVREPEISWLCDVRVDKQTQHATGTISLRIGSQIAMLTKEPFAACYVIPTSRYSLFGIPAEAITACHDGFGPSSEEFYVVRRHDTLLVYRLSSSDATGQQPPRLLKRIRYPQPSNQSMKPTAPCQCNVSVFAMTPCRGLSLFR